MPNIFWRLSVAVLFFGEFYTVLFWLSVLCLFDYQYFVPFKYPYFTSFSISVLSDLSKSVLCSVSMTVISSEKRNNGSDPKLTTPNHTHKRQVVKQNYQLPTQGEWSHNMGNITILFYSHTKNNPLHTVDLKCAGKWFLSNSSMVYKHYHDTLPFHNIVSPSSNPDKLHPPLEDEGNKTTHRKRVTAEEDGIETKK